MSDNMIFSNVMIISDFDGTLLGDDKTVPERNYEAIEYFKSLGGTFSMASGRVHFVLDKTAPKIQHIVNGLCVYSNGSYLYDYSSKTRSDEKYVEESIVRDIMHIVKNTYAQAAIRIARLDEYLTPDENDEIRDQIRKGYMNNVVVFDYDTLPTDKLNKITVSAPNEQVTKIKGLLEERFSEYVDVFLSAPTLIDIQPKNVSKAIGIEKIREYYKSIGQPKVIYCVGDYENDMEMLAAADVACCPSNSLQKVIDFCKIHLCSNNEGCIADLIYKLEKETV